MVRRTVRALSFGGVALIALLAFAHSANAALTLTAGSNATTTPNVATSITGFQIVGPAASTTPVKLRATSGTLTLSTVSGVTMSGNGSGTVNLSGAVSNLNTALSTLTYTRASTGTDTLEVSLVEGGEVFFTTNNHLYKFVSGGFNWTNAKTAAEAQTAYGVSGYLATITSSAENLFVSARLTGDGWIGASDSGTEGDWKWVTGPEAGTSFWSGTAGGSTVGGNYAGWAGGEPNQAGEEDCAETYVSSGTWNDFPCGASLGYVVEFGAPGNLPTVVAQNISIVTADVPALTSLSPTNGAATSSPSTNLVMGFSKTVTKSTGNILIKKYSDDSVVDTILASSSQVTGSGSSSITIDPAVTLDEGTQYYVIVPGTAFKDGSNNFFDGISAKTTWTFTTSDLTAPVISMVATSTIATTSATVTWTTNEAASTKVVYSSGNSYASSTSETDTSPRVTSHSKSITNLAACTSYNFKVVSSDAAGNYATSTGGLFTTLGCLGANPPNSATTTSVTVSATSSTALNESGRTLTVATPANFTATSSSVVIQIRGMNADPVLTEIGKPTLDLLSAASIVFDVKALIDNVTVLDSFDTPVTITYAYTEEDILGLDEESLSMYHYHDGSWLPLDDCSVNTAGNSITCTAPNFSTFAIFGTLSQSDDGPRRRTTSSVTSRVNSLVSMGMVAKAETVKAQWPNLFPGTSGSSTSTTALGVRDLTTNMTGEDVRMLQRLLNTSGHVLTNTGLGSPGNETDYFGAFTREAVSRYQKANGVLPSFGYFGPLTRAAMSTAELTGLWW